MQQHCKVEKRREGESSRREQHEASAVSNTFSLLAIVSDERRNLCQLWLLLEQDAKRTISGLDEEDASAFLSLFVAPLRVSTALPFFAVHLSVATLPFSSLLLWWEVECRDGCVSPEGAVKRSRWKRKTSTKG